MNQLGEPTANSARIAMIHALEAVIERLPPQVQAGVRLAAQTDNVQENEVARVALWKCIEGRAQSNDREVLYVRLGICVLHPTSIAADIQTSVEYFIDTFRRAGLPGAAAYEVAELKRYYYEA